MLRCCGSHHNESKRNDGNDGVPDEIGAQIVVLTARPRSSDLLVGHAWEFGRREDGLARFLYELAGISNAHM